jgi:hypothetical protein
MKRRVAAPTVGHGRRRTAHRHPNERKFARLSSGTELALPPRVPGTDRAFRALARADPAAVLALVGLEANGPVHVEDPSLALPPTIEADFVSLDGNQVFHVEFQGYYSPDFEDRLFRYHLALALRYPERRLRTIAAWLVASSKRDRLLERNGIRIAVEHVVLPERPASGLLDNPRTICFAAGADPGDQTDAELCQAIAQGLHHHGLPWQHMYVAVAAAGARGRYHATIEAMHESGLEPAMIEDLVRLGRDLGLGDGLLKGIERGRAEGIERGRAEGMDEGRCEMAREALIVSLEARRIALEPKARAVIASEKSLDRLREWLRRAATATSLADVLSD